MMIDLLNLVENDLGAAVKKTSGNYWFVCPFHDDRNPSLAVKEGQQFYKCFSCGQSGDDVAWLTDYRKMPMKDALKLARGDGGQLDGRLPTGGKLAARPAQRSQLASPPDGDWQRAALTVVNDCALRLLYHDGDGARAAYDYLIDRGLTEAKIGAGCLGFNPSWLQVAPKCWLAPGITIPCLVGGVLWYVQCRTTAAARAASNKGLDKYHALTGSKLSSLFGAGLLLNAQTAYVTEGEFDALLLSQFLPPGAAAVTMGSAGSLPSNPAWLRYFAAVRRVVLIMDNDAAGSEGAAKWRQLLPLVAVLPVPQGKDIGDYYHLVGGDNLRRWAVGGRYIFPADNRLDFPPDTLTERLPDGRQMVYLQRDGLRRVMGNDWENLHGGEVNI